MDEVQSFGYPASTQDYRREGGQGALWKKKDTLLVQGRKYDILSHASETGSPTNRFGSDKTRGPGILWSVHRWTRPTDKNF